MILKSLNLEDSTLSRLLITVEGGQYIFHQGDRALTMYIIIAGEVELRHRTGSSERQVEVLGAGEIMGEKAVIAETPYKRAFSALARETTSLLEFDTSHFKAIQAKLPVFSHHILRMVIERLERANQLLGILQLKNANERLIQYLLFLYRTSSHRTANGVALTITLERMEELLNLDREFLRDCLEHLTSAKVLLPYRDGYLVSDENALIAFLPELKDRVAA